MNNKLAIASSVALSLALITSSALADTLAVQDGIIFSAGIETLNVSTATGVTLPDTCTSPITITGATATSDVVISGNSAFVKTGDTVTEVTISQCLQALTHNVDECVATVDLTSGKIEIPCLYYQDKVYSIKMDQRGNSMNWEVSFTEENGQFLDYRRGGPTTN